MAPPPSPPPAAPPPPAPAPVPVTPKKGTLAGLIGITAAAILFATVPEEESGRVVDVEIAEDGTPTVEHVRGRQYLQAYLDIAGIPTACDGIIRGVRLGDIYTPEQCTQKLSDELYIHAEGMLRCSPGYDPKAHPYQTVGFVSFTYNIGIGGYCGSSVRRNVIAGNLPAACDRLLPWNKARVRGVLRPVQGLTNRRNREREYCITGIVDGATVSNLEQRLDRWR